MKLDEYLLSKIQIGVDAANWRLGNLEPHPTPKLDERLLLECDIKRRIVELHNRGDDGWCAGCAYEKPWPCQNLRLLSLPYVDLPDYDDEWRPYGDPQTEEPHVPTVPGAHGPVPIPEPGFWR